MQDSAGVTPSYGPASAHSDLTSAYVPAPGPGVVPAPAPDAQHAASPAITEVGDHLVPPPSLALEPQPPSPVDGTVVSHPAPVIAPAAAPELSSVSTPLLTPQKDLSILSSCSTTSSIYNCIGSSANNTPTCYTGSLTDT